MARLAQQAGGAVVANLDLVAMCPAVPNFVPSWFGVIPVGGANTGLCQWGGSCWCIRGWDSGWNSGGAHLYDGELYVDDSLGERSVGGNQFLDGGALLNCCVCQIIKERSHLLHLFKFGGLVRAKCCVPSHHPIDVMHFGKGNVLMGFPVGPSLVGNAGNISTCARSVSCCHTPGHAWCLW